MLSCYETGECYEYTAFIINQAKDQQHSGRKKRHVKTNFTDSSAFHSPPPQTFWKTRGESVCLAGSLLLGNLHLAILDPGFDGLSYIVCPLLYSSSLDLTRKKENQYRMLCHKDPRGRIMFAATVSQALYRWRGGIKYNPKREANP